MRGFAPGVFPIVTTEVARIRGAGRPLVADLFFEAFEFFKAGGENPGSIIPVSVGGQPKRSLAAPDFRLEAYNGFNTFAPEPCDQARWRTVRAYPEAPRLDSLPLPCPLAIARP